MTFRLHSKSYFYRLMTSLSNIVLVLIAIIFIALAYYIFSSKSAKGDAAGTSESTYQLQLSAYERLILLVDRIALHNLISRLNQPGASAREMQQLLTHGIKEEFDYNITQQIYVSADAWNAVKNLKEQNMLVINQIAATLPAHATGLDLNKFILEYLMHDRKGSLHEVVSEVLSYEAKKLLR